MFEWLHPLLNDIVACTFDDVYEMVATCVETMGSFDWYAYMEYGLGEAIMGVSCNKET